MRRHYELLGRDAAIEHLALCLTRASERIESSRGLFYDAPRPYPELAAVGWRWTKEGHYWLAYSSVDESYLIRAVFHEAADIPNRV